MVWGLLQDSQRSCKKISYTAAVLLAWCAGPACPGHDRNVVRRHCSWLIEQASTQARGLSGTAVARGIAELELWFLDFLLCRCPHTPVMDMRQQP